MSTGTVLGLVLVVLGLAWGELITDEDVASRWLNEYNYMAGQVYVERIKASWNYYTNLTTHNQQLMVSTSFLPMHINQN